MSLVVARVGSTSTGQTADRIFRGITFAFALFVLLLLLGIIAALFKGSLPAFQKAGFGFFFSSDWNPVTERFGALPPIYGTLITSIIALLLAVPVSFGIAIFLTELAPGWMRRPVGTAIELLAAVPSIIYGMWGLFVFVPAFRTYVEPWAQASLGRLPIVGIFFSGPPLGISVAAAGVILAIMIVPFIAAVMRDVFETVPAVLKESAYGLGCTMWEVVWRVVLPYTRASVIGGIMLGLGRALGETMAVTFVIGNAHDISLSLFLPGATISSTVANEFTEAVGDVYSSSLIAIGLCLFFITFVVLALARLLLMRLDRRVGS
jgi:phosphate transport system permease protein